MKIFFYRKLISSIDTFVYRKVYHGGTNTIYWNNGDRIFQLRRHLNIAKSSKQFYRIDFSSYLQKVRLE